MTADSVHEQLLEYLADVHSIERQAPAARILEQERHAAENIRALSGEAMGASLAALGARA